MGTKQVEIVINNHNIRSDIYLTAAARRTGTLPDRSMSSNNSNICMWPLYYCSYRPLAILITGRSGIKCKPTEPEVTTNKTGDTVNEVRKIT